MTRELSDGEKRAIREKCLGDNRCVARETAKVLGITDPIEIQRMIDNLEAPLYIEEADPARLPIAHAVKLLAEIDTLQKKQISPLLDFLRRDLEAKKSQRIVASVIYAILIRLIEQRVLYRRINALCAARGSEDSAWKQICYAAKNGPEPDPNSESKVLFLLSSWVAGYGSILPSAWRQHIESRGITIPLASKPIDTSPLQNAPIQQLKQAAPFGVVVQK